MPGGFVLVPPQDLFRNVTPRAPRPPTLDYIVEEYQLQRISLGRAAELAGLPYTEMLEELRKRGVQLQFGPQTVEEAEEELSAFRKWLKKARESPTDRS